MTVSDNSGEFVTYLIVNNQHRIFSLFIEYLSQFLNSQADSECLDHTSVLSFSLSASEQLAALTKGTLIFFQCLISSVQYRNTKTAYSFSGITLLEKDLQLQVFQHHHELISQGKWVENLEEALQNIRSQVKVEIN